MRHIFRLSPSTSYNCAIANHVLSRSSSLHHCSIPRSRPPRVFTVPSAAYSTTSTTDVDGRARNQTRAFSSPTMTAPDSESQIKPAAKRKGAEDSDALRSPPPAKKKLQSGTTKSAVASFFTPASQKPKDRTRWSERASDDDTPATLLVAQYEPDGYMAMKPQARQKVAAFDLDSTLIVTSSGKTHASEATDWKWWDPCVPSKLRELHENGFQIAIFSNQGGFVLHPEAAAGSKTPKAAAARLSIFKTKCASVLSALDLPASLYAAAGRDIFRKPRPGMWNEFLDDRDIEADGIDFDESVFVGDAGGRTATIVETRKGEGEGKAKEKNVKSGGGGKATTTKGSKKDFSCSDRNFAHNVGLKFLTPEEFFLGESPRNFVREFDLANYPCLSKEDVVFEKTNDKEIVIFCGPPGAGKSTFYWKHLKPLGYERVNQDVLKTRDKCVSNAEGHIKGGQAVVVDNTNPDPDTRAVWTKLAKKLHVPIRCVWFMTPLSVAQHNDAVRSMNRLLNPESRSGLPQIAFTGFSSRFREPKASEGFDEIVEVGFKFAGTKEDYDIWGKYWA